MSFFDDKDRMFDRLIDLYIGPAESWYHHIKKSRYMVVYVDGKKRRMQGTISYFGGNNLTTYARIAVTFYVPRLFKVAVAFDSTYTVDPVAHRTNRLWPICDDKGLPIRSPDKFSVLQYYYFNNTTEDEVAHYLTMAILGGEME